MAKQKTARVTVYTTDVTLLKKLRRKLKSEDVSLSQWFRQQVRRALGEKRGS